MRLFYFAFVVLIFSPIQGFASEDAFLDACLPTTQSSKAKLFCQCVYQASSDPEFDIERRQRAYEQKRDQFLYVIGNQQKLIDAEPTINQGIVDQICTLHKDHLAEEQNFINSDSQFKEFQSVPRTSRKAYLKSLTQQEAQEIHRKQKELQKMAAAMKYEVATVLHENNVQSRGVGKNGYKTLQAGGPCLSQIRLEELEENFRNSLSPEFTLLRTEAMLAALQNGKQDDAFKQFSLVCVGAIRKGSFP